MMQAMRASRLALNHMVAARLGCAAFLALARDLGIRQVEIRNDLAGSAMEDGTPAHVVRGMAKECGVSILTINALQRFDDWSDARAKEACDLAYYARDVGAAGLVLVPVNDPAFRPSDATRLKGLRESLRALRPLLDEAGVMGLIEPLGFAGCTLRLKSEAVAAIDDVDGAATFRLVHDTFHHVVAGEAAMFPERTGLIHVSGVTDASKPREDWRDDDRGLVGDSDLLDNLGQIKALTAGGCKAPISLEPFAVTVHTSPTLAADIASSLDVLEKALLTT